MRFLNFLRYALYKLLVLIAAFFLLLAWSVDLESAPLTKAQQQVAAEASQAGAPYDLALTLPAVIGAESSLCADKHRRDKSSHGCAQIQIDTASYFAGRPVTANQLETNLALSLRLAALKLNWCVRAFGWRRGVFCFNHRVETTEKATDADVNSSPYLASVIKWLGILRSQPKTEE